MATDDSQILMAAERWRSDGRRVAVATVIEAVGSAPRPIGSHLIVDERGCFLGSVSAGCVENEVIEAALEVIELDAPRILEFGRPGKRLARGLIVWRQHHCSHRKPRHRSD